MAFANIKARLLSAAFAIGLLLSWHRRYADRRRRSNPGFGSDHSALMHFLKSLHDNALAGFTPDSIIHISP